MTEEQAEQAEQAGEQVATERLRLLTLNLWGERGAWPARRDVLRRELRRLRPDLLTLQETILDDEHDQVRDVLGEDWSIVHSATREPGDGQGVSTASRWPTGRVVEVDLRLTERTGEFACTSLLVEVLAPEPLGRVWSVNHFPDYQLDHAVEREKQAVATARAVEWELADRPGHVVVSGDLDAEPESTSLRFWTGHTALEDTSVCYRDAWVAAHGHGAETHGATYEPDNPLQADPDWPFRRIDHVLVRCGRSGPTLLVERCERVLDGEASLSDHYGVLADLALPVS